MDGGRFSGNCAGTDRVGREVTSQQDIEDLGYVVRFGRGDEMGHFKMWQVDYLPNFKKVEMCNMIYKDTLFMSRFLLPVLQKATGTPTSPCVGRSVGMASLHLATRASSLRPI